MLKLKKQVETDEKDEPVEREFLPVTWPINTALDLSERPMTGHDIARWRARHKLQTSDSIYALCIQNSAKYNEMLNRESLPFTLELLIRLYDISAEHAPWKLVSPKQAYTMLYGDVETLFTGSPYAKEVRLALYRRFTGGMGRSVYTAYRWVQSDGNAKSQVGKIFSKLALMQNPRQVLESIVRTMFHTRREDFDQMFPLPTVESPPQPKHRGPPKGSRKSAESATDAFVASAKPARKAAKSVVKPKATPVAAKRAKKASASK